VAEDKQHFVTFHRHVMGPDMALSYENLRNYVSVFAEAASLDSQELSVPNSLDCGDQKDVFHIYNNDFPLRHLPARGGAASHSTNAGTPGSQLSVHGTFNSFDNPLAY
jgi:hypothetical protein